jgi:hypothetical protein
MPLNPLRDALSRSARAAAGVDSPFRSLAEEALNGFRATRSELLRQVRRGDLTPKVARQRAAEAADALRRDLLARAETFSPASRPFVERLTQIGEARRSAREALSIEGLQRETNRLLRQTLIEQQLVNRQVEFEGRTYVRPMTGGAPAPSLQGLLAFHEEATQAGDDAAREWARRQLEGLRSRTTAPEDLQRIDMACDRPDRVNPRIVARYIEAMSAADASDLERFATEALTSSDANACCAAFALAREAPEGMAARWVRDVLEGISRFPDAAIQSLRAWEAEARSREVQAAQAHAEHILALAEAEVRSIEDAAPSAEEIRRQERIASRPAAAAHEPIGLTLDRRGLSPDEFASLQAEAATQESSEGL